MTARTRRAYDSWSAAYDTDLNPHLALEHEAVVGLVGPRKGMRILDAGCGTGRYAAEFASKGAQVVGIDFSERMLEVARGKLPQASFKRCDLRRRLPLRNGWFDRINCAQTLKHLKSLRGTFREFGRILKAGGCLVFSVTHPDMDWDGYEMRTRVGVDLPAESDIYHHRFCDYLEWIGESGFTIDRLVQLPVSEKIRQFLTPESYRRVKGRYQIVVFRVRKDDTSVSVAAPA